MNTSTPIAKGLVLIGGSHSEGAELALGFSLSGLAGRDRVLRKSGLRAGECLVLTKAIGTGTLFAADMRLRAKGRWIVVATESMLVSSRLAAEVLRAHDVSAATDVTDFGLLGHLVEMTRA